ncbi:transcription elongation regulator 1-like protein isoform X2 [Electrophorus electricus]|uniref:transcription elongation regulator 1-like protein isoform X2 n=1 Tax=Electrophorus electricus TaxID=8005 RepID=UPI0015CFA24E|nr:transcription elongation regulator 1-like protein isoform X2 [Electrophorus electricus]
MIPVQRVKGQPRMWQMSGEPPPLVWMIPTTTGLCAVGSAVPPPFLITSRQPPLLQAVSSWQLSCDPFVPVMRAADPVVRQFPLPNVQWKLPSRSPMLGFQPPAGVDLVPVFPPVYRAILPPHYRKAWLEKRVPDYKVYLNNTLALETTWIGPEEMGIFQRQEKPRLMTNQAAMSISRPVAASRNFHTLLLTPRRISGCPMAVKRVWNNKKMAVSAATLMAMESDVTQGPSASSAHPLHLLSLAPIKIPLLTPPSTGSRNCWKGLLSPVLPAQITEVTSLSSPGVTLVTGDWKDQAALDKTLEVKKPPCARALVFSSDSAVEDKAGDEHFKVSVNIDSSPKDNRPVASTPVPGSPWCVVWTGDDRVFFFNPTMQLSVWEKPLDLQDRGDLNKIIEDPPHKRKKDTLHDGSNSPSAEDEDDEEEDNHISKSKRNKLEEPANCMASSTDGHAERCRAAPDQPVLPLELRVTHFRDMLLERGVSAFSTWEKELHKIVFDPRYLLLGPEERKQIFDQFVKARINEEYKERKNKLQQAKEEFRKLLEESKVTSRSTFKEFSEKYGREPRFKQVPKQKDRELLFIQFVNGLKKRDKENRMKLRKMR